MEVIYNKYKIYIILIKYIPYIIGIISFISVLLAYCGLNVGILTMLSHVNIVPGICMLTCSVLLKFCIWHRLPIYYCWINDVISYIDYNFGIPISSRMMFWLYMLVAIVFILLGMYFKEKYNERKRNSKEFST